MGSTLKSCLSSQVDTRQNAYIKLDELSADLSPGRRVRVQDNRSGEDITRHVLLQALLTEGPLGASADRADQPAEPPPQEQRPLG